MKGACAPLGDDLASQGDCPSPLGDELAVQGDCLAPLGDYLASQGAELGLLRMWGHNLK